MRFIIILLLLIAVVSAGVYGFGRNLPKNHKFTKEMVLENVTIDMVWDAIANYETATTWQPSLEKVERLDDVDGKQVWKFTETSGRFMDVLVLKQEKPVLHASEIIKTDYPFTGTWLFELAPIKEGKVLVKLTETGRVSKPLWRVVIRYMLGVEMGATKFLEQLQVHLAAIAKEKSIKTDDEAAEKTDDETDNSKKNEINSTNE